MNTTITIPHAIKILFNIEVSKESPYLKDKANSFVRNKLIQTVEEKKTQRKSVFLKDHQQLDVLFNALLLNAFYPDPKHVVKIFKDVKFRYDCAQTIRALFGRQSNVAGQALISGKVNELISVLESDADLFKNKLPNPFQKLPQLAFGKNTGLLNCLLLQASALEPVDNVLNAIAKGDWNKARELSINLSKESPGAIELANMIDKKFKDAQEFNDLLDYFKNI